MSTQSVIRQAGMIGSSFLYTTYIRTTPLKLWDALTKPEATMLYWMGVKHETTWKPGAEWKLVFADGRVADAGEILEVDPGVRLILRWRHEMTPSMRDEGYSRCTIELEPVGDSVKLTVRHMMAQSESTFIADVSIGWPMILSSLKSYVETGKPLALTAKQTPST